MGRVFVCLSHRTVPALYFRPFKSVPDFWHNDDVASENPLGRNNTCQPTMLRFIRSVSRDRLDASWSEWLGELAITPQPDGDTLLSGPIIDQAALHGILDKLYGLNLTILSVVQVRSES